MSEKENEKTLTLTNETNSNEKNVIYNCPRCLNEIDKEDKFCRTCGFLLSSCKIYPTYPQPKTEEKKKNFSIERVILVTFGVIIAIYVIALIYLNLMCSAG